MRMRSLLFVPANRARFYERLAEFRPDAVILDLEDAIAPSEKTAARDMAGERIGSPSLEGLPVFVRVNPIGSEYFRDDIRAVTKAGLFGVFLPKIEEASALREANMLLGQSEVRSGMPLGAVHLVPILETVRGVLRAEELANAAPRVFGIAFGAEDFTRDLGVGRTADGMETRYPRAHVALVARASRAHAFDTPWARIDDSGGLRRETLEARQLGFSGKQAIHPSQISVIHEAFAPSDAEVAWARRVIDAYAGAIELGRGAIQLDGQLIDVPMVERARQVIARLEPDA